MKMRRREGFKVGPLLIGEAGGVVVVLGGVQVDLLMRHVQITAPDDRLALPLLLLQHSRRHLCGWDASHQRIAISTATG